MNRRALFNGIRIIVSLSLIVFLFWLMRDNFQKVIGTIRQGNKSILLISFLIYGVGVILLGARLRFIMRTQRLNITLRHAVYLTFIGLFFSNFLPTAAGGDLVKAYYASKRTGKKISSVACIMLDRILGTLTLVLMVLITSLFVKEAFSNKLVLTFLITALIASLLIVTILFSRRVAKRVPFLGAALKALNLKDKMTDIYEVIYNYRKHPRLLLNAVFISVALQVIFFSTVYLIARGLNLYIPLKLVLLLMPIITTASMAPSINGLGVREGSFVVFFGPIVGKEEAFALGILWLGVSFGMSLVGGVSYLFGHRVKLKKEIL